LTRWTEKTQAVTDPSRTFLSKERKAQTHEMPRRTGCRVGTLCTLKLAVYARSSDGSLYFMEEGRRVDLQGNQKWLSTDGRQMRGCRFNQDELPSYSSDSDGGEEEDMARAVAASLQSEEAQISAAIQASLAAAGPTETQTSGSRAPATASCSICMDDIAPGQAVRALRCAHSFHAACVNPWLRSNRTCPVCREDA
jgi:hypothetical protein